MKEWYCPDPKRGQNGALWRQAWGVQIRRGARLRAEFARVHAVGTLELREKVGRFLADRLGEITPLRVHWVSGLDATRV